MLSTNSPETSSLIYRFEKIYADTYGKLYGFVKRYLKDQQAVKDVLQDCYIRLWERMETVMDDEKILPMLKVWAINATTDAVRKNARDMERAYVWQSNQEKISAADDRLYVSETMRQYHHAKESLPPQQRLVFSLVREEGLTQQQAADQLKISIHTVKRHLGEALRTLRAKMPENVLKAILIVAEVQSRMFP